MLRLRSYLRLALAFVPRWWNFRSPFFRLAASVVFALGGVDVRAAPGPGLNQVTWLPSEIGHEVFTFSNSVVGAQPTMNDFQWGYLVIEAAHSLDVTQPGKISWYNFSNPR